MNSGATRCRPGVRHISVAARLDHFDKHYAESVLHVPGMKLQRCVALLRSRPGGRAFTTQDVGALEMLHSELAWVYAPNLLLAAPGVSRYRRGRDNRCDSCSR